MANYTATPPKTRRRWRLGDIHHVIERFTTTIAPANGDTITFPNALPDDVCFIVDGSVTFPKLDTNATPTGTIVVGNSDSANGYVTTKSVGSTGNNSQVIVNFDGALLATPVQNRNIVITVTAAMATAAAAGASIDLRLTYECGALT